MKKIRRGNIVRVSLNKDLLGSFRQKGKKVKPNEKEEIKNIEPELVSEDTLRVKVRKSSRNTEDKEEKVTKQNKIKNEKEKKEKETKIRRANDKKYEESISKGIDILNNYKKNLYKKREERIGKTPKILTEENEEKNKFFNLIRIIMITILIIVFIVVVYIFLEYGPIFGTSLNKDKGITEDWKIDIITTDQDSYQMYNEEFLMYSNGVLRTFNKYGKNTWEYKLDGTYTPQLYVCGRFLVVSNNSNGTIFLFENKKEILDKKIDGTIQSICLDENGNMAIEYSTNTYKRVINVYTKSGKLKYTVYFSNGTIENIKLLDNGDKLLILQSKSNSFTVGANISIIDGTKKENSIENILTLDNNLVYDLTIQGQNLIILLDNRIIKYNIDSKKTDVIQEFDSNQMLFVALADNYYVDVEKTLSEENDEYIINTRRFDNTQIGKLNIQNSPKIMKNSGLLNYFIYQDSLQVVNKWGIDVKNIKLEFPPKDIVVFNNEKSVALIYTNKIYFVNM